MSQSVTRRLAPASILFSLIGLLLFFFYIRKTGVGEILNGVSNLGAGFLIVLGLSGLRLALRAFCWMRCFESPYSLRFRDAFKAYLSGDAMGNLMPLGIMVSEPVKAACVRHRVPLAVGLSTIAVENLFYSLSVALFIFFGTIALLFSFSLPSSLRTISLIALAGVVVTLLIAYVLIRLQLRMASRLLDAAHRRGIWQMTLEANRERVSDMEEIIYGFYERNRARFLSIMFLEACFHLIGVAEVYVTLLFISGDVHPTLLTAFILESANRVITVVFKFVPLRVGVDEAGTGMLTKVLKFGTTVGVTLAIIRKARTLFWTGLGVAILMHRGLSIRKVVHDAEEAIHHSEAHATQFSALK